MRAPLQLSLRYAAREPSALSEERLLAAALAVFESAGWRPEASCHRWEPHGLSIVLVAAEATLILHTWPELRSAWVDWMLLQPADVGTLLAELSARAGLVQAEQATRARSPT